LEALNLKGLQTARPLLKARPDLLRVAALAIAVLLGIVATGWSGLTAVDAQLHDFITRSLPVAKPAPQDVVLIDIDESSLAQIGPWPWPRSVLADMVIRLRERGARVQAWDLFLSESAPGDATLNQALSAGADIILGQVLIVDPQVQNPPQIGRLRVTDNMSDLCAQGTTLHGYFGIADSLPAARAGHLSATPDADGALRRLPAVLCQGNARYPQLTLKAAEALYPQASWQLSPGNSLMGPAQWLSRGPMRFALDAQSRIVVPYTRPHPQWTAVSALKLLDGTLDPRHIQGKVVVVGATALGLVDTASTPFHPNAPGVSVHAEILSAALNDHWTVVPPVSWPYVVLISSLTGLMLLLSQRQLRQRRTLFVAGFILLGVPLLAAVLGRSLGPLGLMLPVAAPTLALGMLASLLISLQMDAQRRRTHQLTHHLESFLPGHLAREIASQDPSGESLGRSDTGVILAVRVSGLQRWSAGVGSLKALALIHAISSLAETHARRQDGTLEHVQGDTLLLSWPTHNPDTANRNPPIGTRNPGSLSPQDAVQNAVHAARSLLVELGDILVANETETAPLSLRMAIDQGDFLLAVAGSRTSRRSLMLGRAIDNVLAMLPLCAELASPILMGQRAAQAGSRLSAHPMGQFLLPETRLPQIIYRVEP
jgi:adenylate cyclase